MSNPNPVPGSTIAGAGPKVALIGDSGTGKSHSLRTLIDAGITPFVIATEQNFVQVMSDLLGKSCHYKFIAPQAQQNWSQILDMATKINMLSYENLTKTVDPFKQASNKFLDLLTMCNKFVCDCCQKDWGCVNNWNTDRAICIDSFTGVSDMAFNLVVGNKPVRSMPDYQVAQNALRMFLGPLTSQTKCTVVIVCHLEREKDEITGGTFLTIKSVGQKVGPDIPRMFSDVIRTRREATTFSWDTADTQSTVTARNIPIASNQKPSFVPLIEAWKKRGNQILATP
jgi:hypothetical protein